MYNSDHLKNLCNTNNSLSELYGIKIDKVEPKTVRTKGQFSLERFFYMREGKQKFTLKNGETIIAQKGDIIYLPPDITYVSEWETNPDNKAIAILFSLSDGQILSDNLFIIVHDKYEIYLNLFLNFISHYEKGQLGYKIKCQALFWEIFHNILIDILKSEENKADSSVHKGILYIDNNYMSKIDINELAKMCYTSPSTFRRRFRKATGMSPIEYKNKLKIIKASELLKTGEYSVKEAAKEVNIEDIYYFSKMFKKHTNTTPSSLKNYPKTNSTKSFNH